MARVNKSVDGKKTHENSPVQYESKARKDQNYRYDPEMKKHGKALRVQPMTSKLV